MLVVKYVGFYILVEMVKVVFDEIGVDVVFYLDYGLNMDVIKICIDVGFFLVMIDGFYFDFEENVRIIKEVVEYVYFKGVVVEVEFGVLVGIEDDVIFDVYKYI